MSWLQLHFHTQADSAEHLENLLLNQGALSVTLQDNADQPLLEPGVGETPLWDATKLSALFPKNINLENLIDADSAPILAKQLIFATNYQGNLTAFDIAQKRPVWSEDASSFYSPIAVNNMIMVIQDDSSIISFSLNNLSKSWTSEEYLRRDLSNGAVYKNLLLVGDLEGYVHVINPLTGITVGRKKVTGKPIMSIVTFRDLAYVIDQDSNIVAIKL